MKMIPLYKEVVEKMKRKGKVVTLSKKATQELDKKLSDAMKKARKEFERIVSLGYIKVFK